MPDTTVSYSNLAGVYSWRNDGNTVVAQPAAGPRTLIVGTAGQGRGSVAYLVTSTSTAKTEFGTSGTLLRGMWEARTNGAEELALYRIGATSAVLTGVGDSTGAAGYTITTVMQDNTAGASYAIYYDDATNRIVIQRTSDDLVVYDATSGTVSVNEYEVTVSGNRAAAGGPNIGSASSLINLEDVDASTYAGTSFTAGTDGLDLSRMEMYEKLYVAYEHLKMTDFDVIVPMDVYLDDYNVVAQGHYAGAVTPVSPSANTYPTAGAFEPGNDVDALGSVFVEEYEGNYYFWWWYDDPSSGTFTAADLYPTGVGSASSTTKIDGTALAASDFHEVNFAYQLGRFLYEYGTNVVDATGVIGVKPPASFSAVDLARWVGRAPTYTLNTTNGLRYITSISRNGSGLLGNKFMAGRYGYRGGIQGGGFIATEDKFLDSGTEVTDDNDIAVDLGKYLSIVIDYPLLRNSFSSTAYVSSFAASYGGFYVNMSPASAPTNKKVSSAALIFNLGLQKLDDLAGTGYVCLRQKTTGLIIADAPTATLPSSDWRRLSTMRIAKAIIDGVRAALDPFLGEGTSPSTREAMHVAVENVLLRGKKAKYLQDYREFEIIQTPDMQVAGTADVNLVIVPAFEIRQIRLTVSAVSSV